MDPTPNAEPLVGQTLGRYRILQKIGAGGMGEVFLSRDERLERDVALKVIRTGTLANEAARARFRNEALSLSKLNHPNIATIFDFDSQGGVDFLVMEYVEGESLAQKLGKGPLPEREVADLGRQLAEGLAAAHAQGVVHRDLKPGNVRLTPDGRLKILDFGLAKLVKPLDESQTVTRTAAQSLVGTPRYMSPEQLRLEPVDPRTDIWAVGVILYEMLTGHHPFGRGGRPADLLNAILKADPPSISALRTDVPRRLEEITVQALEKRPQDRPASASCLADDLRETLRLLETTSEVIRGRRVLSRRAKRKLVWVSAGSVVLLALAIMAILQEVSVKNAQALPAIAVVPLASIVGQDEVNRQTRMVARMLTTDLGESSHIRVLGSAALQNVLTNQELGATSGLELPDLQGIARSARLSHIVTLSILHAGDTFRADVEVVSTEDGQTVATATEEVLGEDRIVELIDPLAAKMRRALLSPEQLATEQDRPFGDITSTSRQAVMLFYQGLEYDIQANTIRAHELYNQVLDLDPDFLLARMRLAVNSMGNEAIVTVGDDERLSEYERLAVKAQNAMAAGDCASELAAAREMLRMRPGDWLSLSHKYLAEYFLGRYGQAVATCEEAVRSGYRGYEEHLLLNSSYTMSGLRPEEIVDRYLGFLDQDPSDAMMRFWLGMTYLVMNRDQEAEAALALPFELYPGNDALLKVTADTYMWRESSDKESDYEVALANLRRLNREHIAYLGDRAVKKTNTDEHDWLYLGTPISFDFGEVFLLQGKVHEAVRAYERSLELRPDHYRSYYRLGQAHDLMGNREEAIDALERYIAVPELNWYDSAAQGREAGCAATQACHSISRPVALADCERRLARLRQ